MRAAQVRHSIQSSAADAAGMCWRTLKPCNAGGAVTKCTQPQQCGKLNSRLLAAGTFVASRQPTHHEWPRSQQSTHLLDTDPRPNHPPRALPSQTTHHANFIVSQRTSYTPHHPANASHLEKRQRQLVQPSFPEHTRPLERLVQIVHVHLRGAFGVPWQAPLCSTQGGGWCGWCSRVVA